MSALWRAIQLRLGTSARGPDGAAVPSAFTKGALRALRLFRYVVLTGLQSHAGLYLEFVAPAL